MRHNSYVNDPYAKEFGIKISDKLAAVEARILPAPQVIAAVLSCMHVLVCIYIYVYIPIVYIYMLSRRRDTLELPF